MTSLLKDFGQVTKAVLHMDASAALGVIQRKGVGKVRHLDVSTLWLQEQQLRRIIALEKVEALKNPADLLTKSLTRERIDAYSDLMSYEYHAGRAKSIVGLNMFARRSSVELSHQPVGEIAALSSEAK